MDDVYNAEPNYIYECALDSDDFHYINNNLWGLNGTNGIDIENAWNFTTGSNAVRVGVIDTGISNHPDLDANLVPGIDTYNDNFITNDDTHSHGTHVAGIIGAVGNNEIGVVGVNWNVSLVPLQAANSNNNFFASDVIKAIEWAQDRWETNERISIINYSVGGYGRSTAIRTAINNYDGLFVWAVGNDGEDIDERIMSNGSFNLDNIISVGALNCNRTRRSSSNFSSNNTNVNIYAPGSNIYSTVPTSYSSYGYSFMSGTSMAAPYVSGVAALLLSINKDLTASQLKHAILGSAESINISIPYNSEESNVGQTVEQEVLKLNAYNAVKYILNNYVSTTILKYNTKLLCKYVDSISTFFNEKNYFLKMNVENSYEYEFTISSTSEIEVTLFDSNFNEITTFQTSNNGGLTKTFNRNLLIGTYYLRTNFVSSTANGVVNISIIGEAHSHTYNDWIYYNRRSHIIVCNCGMVGTTTRSHVISSSEAGNRYATCLECGYLLDLTRDTCILMGLLNTNITQYSLNGSYILPSGIIVLVDKDLDSYLNGTLEFYNKNESLVSE